MTEKPNVFAVVTGWSGTLVAFALSHVSAILGIICMCASLVATLYAIKVNRAKLKRMEEEERRRSLGNSVLFVLVALTLTGCLPSTKTSRVKMSAASDLAAAHNAAITRSLELPSQPPVNVKVDGSSNRVDISLAALPAARSSVTIDSSGAVDQTQTEAASETWKVSIPVGVKIALLGIGLLILLYALNALRRSSAAVSAAWDAADSALASRIRSLRERAVTETNPVTLAELSAQIAALESDRGRLASRR